MRQLMFRAGKACASCLAVLLLVTACGSNDSAGSRDLTGIEIEPASPQLAKGSAQQLAATGIFADGAKADLTGQVTWSSGNTAVATITSGGTQAGLLQGLSEGTSAVTATYRSFEVTTIATVTQAAPVALSLSPDPATVPLGATVQLTATATFSDNSTQNVTASSNWTSVAPATASVSNAAASKGQVRGESLGSTLVSASYQGLGASATVNVPPAQIARIELEPASPSVPKGTTRKLTATAVYTDDTTQDVTDSAAWSSATPAIATVGDTTPDKGLVEGLELGTAAVSASYGGVTGTTNVQVSSALVTGLEVTPVSASIAKGTQQAFVATALFSDDSTQDVSTGAVWTSSDTDVATISNTGNASGRATAVDMGQTVIGASYMDFEASAELTVTDAVLARIDVTPANAQLPVGRTQQYSATGVFTDGTTQDLTALAAWSSDNGSVVSVSNANGSKGFAAGQSAGSTKINAAYQDLTGSTAVTVTNAVLNAIQVSPNNSKLAKTYKRQFTATGLFSDNSNRDITAEVVWSSSDSAIATISNAAGSKGLSTGLTAGPVTISASQSGVSGSAVMTVTDATLTSIGVTPVNPELPKGVKQQFQATGTFSDASTQDLTTQVSWASSAPTVASVSNAGASKGEVSALVPANEPATISATLNSIVGSSNVTVTDAALSVITIEPATVTLPKGNKQAYKATGRFTDNSTLDITNSVTWSSSTPAVATISNAGGEKGEATAVAEGQTTIGATQDDVNGTATLTVTAAVLTSISVTPATPTIAKGRTQQFTATGTYSDASTRALTGEVQWTSSKPTVATISNADADAGLATAEGVGESVIAAAMSGVSGNTTLTVTAAELETLTISPATASVPKGESLQLTASGSYSDGSTANLTSSVTWSSSDNDIAEVSNAAASKGRAFGKTEGSVTIRADDVASGKFATRALTVTAAPLVAITVNGGGSVPVGYTRAYTAQGQYGDGSSRDLTAEVSWSTVDPAVATISNTAPNKGRAEGVAPGSTTVVASLSGVQGTAPLTVTNATVTAIVVTPANSSFGAGQTKQYTATATLSDSTQLDITHDVTWASSNLTAASISNAAGSKGLASAGLLPGTTTISATSNSVSGSTSLTRN